MEALLEKYAEHLVNDYYKWGGKDGDFKVEFERGSKYTRVITVSHGSRSGHSFIVNYDFDKWSQGDILKAATWKAPARNFNRGNINNYDSYKDRIRWAGCE